MPLGRGAHPLTLTSGWPSRYVATAANTADAPGIATTSPPAAAQAATSPSPGSETTGVPASVTSARSCPPARCASSSRSRAGPLRAWKLVVRVRISYRPSKRRVIRVSSAAISGTARRT